VVLSDAFEQGLANNTDSALRRTSMVNRTPSAYRCIYQGLQRMVSMCLPQPRVSGACLMNSLHRQGHAQPSFELRFGHLFLEGRGLAFPCDARGEVQLDSLSDRARERYLYARALIGREYTMPQVALRDPELGMS
jgi:hypothetical protein